MVTSAPAVAPGGVIEFGESPVFSPDGSQVAYTWCTKAGRNCLGYLRIARVPTGPPQTPRVLYAHGDWTRAYDWSPDAKQLAVVITRSTNVREIALLSTADGSKRVLREIADGRLPRRMLFSPDGKYLAYDDGATTAVPVAWNRRRSEVHVIDVAGGEPRLISADAAHSLVAGWSPDGRRLVFTADSGGTMDLYAAEMVNGRPAGRPVLIRSDLGAVAPLGMSRSGTFFYQVRSGGGTHLEQAVFDFTKGEFVKAPAPVAELTPTGDMPPQWSPDGKWLAYHYQRNATPQSKSSVVVRSASGDDLREIKTDFTINRRLLWSADGRSLYAIGVDAQGVDGLFAVDVRSGGSTRLAGDAPGSTPLDRLSNLHVNKRGTHAYFTRSRGPRHHVVQFDLTTLDEKELFAFDSVGNPPPPAFAPDGSKAFYRRWMRPVPGTRGVDILLERDLRSGAERELHKGIVTWALLSPDGRHLAVRLGDVGNKWNSIAVFPTSGDAVPRELMRDEGPAGLFILAWSPDSASLLINRPAKEGAGREAWWLPLNGEAKRVDRRIANMSIHPDGRRVALVRAGEPRRSEIWAMERFLPAK